MNISSVCIQNFRKLYQCHIDFSNDTTLFVGANNSGKTSAGAVKIYAQNYLQAPAE